MKKILFALAVLLSLQIADAQTKSPADARKAVEAAAKDAENPKKAIKVATWTKLGDAYLTAYSAPAGQGWRGARMQELQLVLGTEKPVSTESVVLYGAPYTKEIYQTRNYYYNTDGILEIIEITAPVYEDALAKALEAYNKAYELDVKGSKTKDIAAGIQNVATRYMEEGIAKYMLGDNALASELFEAAVVASETAPYSQIDSMSVYNAGFTAELTGNYERAGKFFQKAVEIGYYENGEAFSKLANAKMQQQDTLAAKVVFEEGFAKFPESQSILIGLINYYMQSGDSPDQLFVLLDKAKENEPNNASLYYVEGDINSKLGRKEEAIAAYTKASEVNPEYEFGWIGIGILYYNDAIEISEKAATEMDDAKYEALVKEFEQDLLKAAEPFEKAFAVSKDDTIRVNIAEYLKNIYYRFRTTDQKYMDGYNKYDAVVKSGTSGL